MSLPTYNVKSKYLGNNTVATYTFGFKITDLSQLRVLVVKSVDNTTIFDVRGTDTTNLQSVKFDELNGGGSVTLPANLATGRTIYLLFQNDAPVQLSRFMNKFDFTNVRIERALDYVMGCVQYLTHKMHRSVTISDIDSPTTFNAQLPPGLGSATAAGRFPVLNDTGTGWAPLASWKKLSDIVAGAGASAELGVPTDGKYGDGQMADGIGDSVTSVDEGITINDAFDFVVTTLGYLLPVKPKNLSAVALQIAGSYGPVKISGTGATAALAIDSTTPTIVTDPANRFGDGKQGTLTATMDAGSVGTTTLTTGSDVGTYGALQITEDVDPYAGGTGQNIYQALKAQINSAILTLGSHVATMVHSLTGTTTLAFEVDDPGAVTASSGTITPSGTTGYISGVPAYVTGALMTVGFTIANAVRSHYNATKVADATFNGTTTNVAPSGTYNSGDAISVTVPFAVSGGLYSAGASASGRGYNSKSVAGSSLPISSSVRIDSISSESARVKSGTGGFPTLGSTSAQFGDAYDSTVSLATNKELQMIGGVIQYPPLVSYTTKLPAGPDYTGLTSDTSYNNVRWYTKKLGTAASASNWTFTLSGPSNVPNPLAAGVYMFLKVQGATGWLNANAAYPGVGVPAADNDPALDVANSTAAVRKVTFGTTTRSGDVYVRIGVPSGSSMTFTGVT